MPAKLWRLFRSPPIIFLVALALRLGGLTYFRFLHPSPAARDYWGPAAEIGRIAASVARGQGFSSPYWAPTGPTALLPPVFPYMLAGVFKLFGVFTTTSAFVILALNCLFSASICIPLAAIGRRAFDESAGFAAAWLWALWPSATLVPVTELWYEPLVALLLITAVWATLRLGRADGLPIWMGVGILWGVAALTDPSVLAPMPFVLGWLCLQRRKHALRWARPCATALLAFGLTILPWLARNYLAFGRPVFIRDGFGLQFYAGNRAGATGTGGHNRNPGTSADEWEQYRRLGELGYMLRKQHEATLSIEHHPAAFVRRCATRFAALWVWPSDMGYAGRALGAGIRDAQYTALPVAATVGLALALEGGVPEAVPLALLLCAFPLVYLVTLIEPRYRYPIEPEMALLAAFALTVVTRRFASLAGPPQAPIPPP